MCHNTEGGEEALEGGGAFQIVQQNDYRPRFPPPLFFLPPFSGGAYFGFGFSHFTAKVLSLKGVFLQVSGSD